MHPIERPAARRDPEPFREEAPPVLGLALGGGAILGFVHLGILGALRDAAIPVHRICGTSAGAVAAAFHAFGVSPEATRDILVCRTWRRISRPSVSLLGLLSNEPLGDLIREQLGDARIEDAPIPLAIVAADIHTGREVVLTEGPVADAVRASAAVPVLYTPVSIDGRVLVDGGVLGNVPVGPLRRMGSDLVVAASLGDHLDFQPVRNIVGVLANAFLMAVNKLTRQALAEDADVVIQPDLDGRSHWLLDDPDELIGLGYRAGVEATPLIRQAVTAFSTAEDPAIPGSAWAPGSPRTTIRVPVASGGGPLIS